MPRVDTIFLSSGFEKTRPRLRNGGKGGKDVTQRKRGNRGLALRGRMMNREWRTARRDLIQPACRPGLNVETSISLAAVFSHVRVYYPRARGLIHRESKGNVPL